MEKQWLLALLACATTLHAQDSLHITAVTQPPPAFRYVPFRFIHDDIRRHILFTQLDMPERGFPMWGYRALATRGTDVGFGIGAWRLADTSGVVLAWWDMVEQYRSGEPIEGFSIQYIEFSDEAFLDLARKVQLMREGTLLEIDRGRRIRNCMVAPFDERITIEACAHHVSLWIDQRTRLRWFYSDVNWWLRTLPHWFR